MFPFSFLIKKKLKMSHNKTSEVMWGRATLNHALTINLSIPCISREYKKKNVLKKQLFVT